MAAPAVRSPRELDTFRRAGEVVSGALTALMQSLLEGRSEAESAGEAARLVARGRGHTHMLAVSHGPYVQHLASDPLVGFSQIISVRVGHDADFVLRENMVISIEVFLSRRGVGQAGFENNASSLATPPNCWRERPC
jgi:Xaa-Pro aminopeptidase